MLLFPKSLALPCWMRSRSKPRFWWLLLGGREQLKKALQGSEPTSAGSKPALNSNQFKPIVDIGVPQRPWTQVSVRFGGYGVGLTWESGPSRSLKLLVLSTWTPALCSPLKGVTVSGPPAFFASF